MSQTINFMRFPSVDNATEDGLLAMGGELNLDSLVSAYSQGIFPWFSDEQPVLWWSPDPRTVLFPSEVKVSRSLAKTLRRQNFKVSCNRAFSEVIDACALRGERNRDTQVPNQDTWITNDMQQAYTELHQHQYAHSIEVWQGDDLVGGLYGVVLGRVFFGESMFSRVNDASKVALVALCQALQKLQFSVIDCQVASDHLFTLGAREVPRTEFLKHLKDIDIQEICPNFSQAFMHPSNDNVITTV